jgi:hypothetical protein
MIKVNKKYKDRLFRMVFHEKEALLALYNAVSGSSFTDPDEVEIVTLDDVIYMGTKNDAAFLIDDILNLYEHQSTQNPNMPLRGVFYMADEYRRYIDKYRLNVYGNSLIRLPLPQYYVFYNGLKEEPDRTELKISDAYSKKYPDLVPCLEFKATMLNINIGHNQELMEHCQKLKEYAQFVDEVRKRLDEGARLEDAADGAVNSCIEKGILAEFLITHRAEVNEVVLTEYDEQFHIACEKEESRQEGLEEGMKALVETCAELGIPKAGIIQKLQEKFALSHESAEKYAEEWMPVKKAGLTQSGESQTLTEYDSQFHISCEKEDSRQEGIRQVREQGIKALIEAYAELDIPRARIAEKVAEKFSLSKDTSEKYMETWFQEGRH